MAYYSFKVDPVKREIASSKFGASSLVERAEQVQNYWKEEHSDEPQLKLEVVVSNHPDLVSPQFFENHQHGLLSAVLMAYNNHVPLVLSPDDFWLLIALSVGQFLGQNGKMAEKYRHTFVSHKGKKKLEVRVEKYGIIPKNAEGNKNGWPGAIEEMCQQIKTETATNIADIMTTPFSTSGNVEQTVMRATLMETMKNYFEYVCRMMCGIPEITLEGTPDDYKSIIDRIDGLMPIFPDFEWYLSRIRPHAVKIHASRLGKPDKDWWQRMVNKVPMGSGVGAQFSEFSGWLSDFMAFTCNPDNKNPSISRENRGRCRFSAFNKPAITLTDFSLDDGLYTMMHYDMKFAAGFIGVAMDKDKEAIRPAIGWMTFYYKEQPL